MGDARTKRVQARAPPIRRRVAATRFGMSDRWHGRQVMFMEELSLDAVAREHLLSARTSGSGRAAGTVFGGQEKILRQTVVALTAGTVLAEHENPGEATVVVLTGRVRLVAPHASWEGRDGDLIVVPPTRHSLEAVTDAAVLLTVAKRA